MVSNSMALCSTRYLKASWSVGLDKKGKDKYSGGSRPLVLDRLDGDDAFVGVSATLAAGAGAAVEESCSGLQVMCSARSIRPL